MPTERRPGTGDRRGPGQSQRRLPSAPGRRPGSTTPPPGPTEGPRRLAWHSDPAPAPKPDLRDQLGLRIGWVRFWLRALTLGFGISLIGASLLLWRQGQGLAPYFIVVGVYLMPIGGVLTLLSWIVPLPHERTVPCPSCGTPTRVLSLPRRLPYTCRHCKRQGTIERGRIEMAQPAATERQPTERPE